MLLKRQFLLKKGENRTKIDRDIRVQSMSPLNEQRAGIGVGQKTYKHHIFERTAGARCSNQTLHGDRG